MTALRNYRGTDLVDSLSVLSPDILILSFGLNIAAFPKGPNRRYSTQIEEVISELRSGMPDVPCLVLGPYPVATKLKGRWKASPSVPLVGQAQRACAHSPCACLLDGRGASSCECVWREGAGIRAPRAIRTSRTLR